jgi:hypothetical protein
MAFCPNCGKPVTEQASKCLACGQEFEPRAKAARFKGTMMMTPAGAPAAAAQPATAKAAAAPAAQPASSAATPATPATPGVRTTTPGPSKVAKVTMLGTGGMGIAPQLAPPGPARATAQQAPPPAAGAAQPPASSTGPTSVSSPPAASPAPTTPAMRDAPADAGDRPAAASQREDSQRFLAGDPMAPSPTGQRARRMTPQPGSSAYSGQRAGVLVVVGLIGMLVIAAVGYFAARFMGLIQ